MAKKGGTKGAGFEYHTLTSDQKAQVTALCETYPDIHKDHLAIILQHYSFDQDKAQDAITTDGGGSAVSNWQSTQANQAKVSNKNKKKNKKKNRKDNGSLIGIVGPGTDAEDSSSIHSSNIDFDVEKESISKLDCDEVTEKVNENILSMCNSVIESSCEPPISINEGESSVLDDRVETPEGAKSDDCPFPSLEVDPPVENIERLSPKEDEAHSSRHYQTKYSQRQRHGSSHHSKSSSISEDQHPQVSAAMKKFVKSKKDLSRQSVSLHNIELKLKEKLDEAGKSITRTFSELRDLLEKRQAELELQLERVKTETLNVVKSRQDLAADLKARMDRGETAPDSEWLELRSDIKQFVTERKLDDQLGQTIWFMWSEDSIKKEISKFGEVIAFKNTYSQRISHSRNQSSPELNRQDSNLKNNRSVIEEQAGPESSMGGSQEDDTKVEKEHFVKMGQGENRARIFSNRRYRGNYNSYPQNLNNRGRAGHFRRGNNYGGNFNRGRMHENSYRQFGGGDRLEHRQQQYHQEKVDVQHLPMDDNKLAETSGPNTNDSNNPSATYSSNPRGPYRDHGRSQHRRAYGGYRQKPFNNYYVQSSSRPNKPPRPNSETGLTGADTSNVYDQPSQDKQEMNGFC